MQKRKLTRKIVVWARRGEIRDQLNNECPWCDKAVGQVTEAVVGSDLVIACTPVEHIVQLFPQIGPFLQPGALVTDVGSVKARICQKAREILPPSVHFVGSHPMAGSEKSGMLHARPDLYENRFCFVTPQTEDPTEQTDIIVQFWKALGMQVRTKSPLEHDEIVAHISHLPHFLATVLSSHLSNKPEEWAGYSGGGLRDTTRIAAGDPGMWTDIITQNRDQILSALEEFQKQLLSFQKAVAESDDHTARQFLDRGKSFRDHLENTQL